MLSPRTLSDYKLVRQANYYLNFAEEFPLPKLRILLIFHCQVLAEF